jgi:predicted ATPase/class 3 adenylate cyclase
MSSVSEWLASLGLATYAQRFAESAIDMSVLLDLTEQDLQELGVLLGHRRKLMRAIGELKLTGSQARQAYRDARRDHAERRQVTVAFCDLVDSTAMAQRLDPEDMRSVISAYNGCVAGVIGVHDGIVAQYLGDGVLAYFGYPQAHEDDAMQAVRAGLALVDAVAGLTTVAGAQLRVRIGIATGTVVAGELSGEVADQEHAVVGETPNLAARLQGQAEPGTVVICANTRRLSGEHFDCRDLGPITLKGFANAVPAWQVLGPSSMESRIATERRKRSIPLLGRDEEMEVLLRRWQQARNGEGRVVLLTGEPGIGKSHILLALHEALKSEPHVRLRYFCSAHHCNSALFPFIGQLEQAARFERGDSPEAKRGKLESLLERSGSLANHAAALLAHLLSLPSDSRDPLPEASPQKRRQMTMAALLAQLVPLVTGRTVLIIVEDVHWIDPTSLELLTLLVQRVQTRPVLVVMTARPEFVPPWPRHAYVTTIPLTRLSRRDSVALVERVTGGKRLPAEVLKQILDRTDGVPLFVEELTKAVVESELLQQRGSDYALERPMPVLAIPATLQASLAARLDRLAQAKDVAQIGAVLGREFSWEMLSTLAGWREDRLEEALNELVGSELVYCRGEPPDAVYTFKHVLVRDAAYAGLLRSQRVRLHAEIASTFERDFPEIVAAQPETLAHHLTEAGLAEKAVRYWLQAGRIAAARSANAEAVAHLQRGIDAVRILPESPVRDRVELELQVALAPCLIATQGAASGIALATFQRARDLCEHLGDPPEYLQVLFWIATASVVRGELPQALEADMVVLERAEARGDVPARLNAIRGQGMILLFMGRIVEAREVIDRALAAFEAASEAERLAARAAGQDCGVACLALMSWASWLLGHADSAVTEAEAAVRQADAIEHAHTRAYASYYASVVAALRGEPMIARRYAEHCLTLSVEHGFRHWQGLASAVRGICLATMEPSGGLPEEVTAALQEYRSAGYQLGITALYVLLVPTLLLKRRPEAALEAVEQGLALVDANSERLFAAELYRLKAQALVSCAAADAPAQAENWLERALATARAQQARSLELRVATDLAATWADLGRRADIHEMLAPIVAAFVEGSENRDLERAKAVLDRLG